MTFIVGFVKGQGVLMASDDRVSLGYVVERDKKLFPIYTMVGGKEQGLALVGGSGLSGLVKQSVWVIERAFKGFLDVKQRAPTDNEVEDLLDTIQRALALRYRELRANGVEINVGLMLGLVTCEGRPHLYVFSEDGIYEARHESPGYAMLGAGRDVGGALLLNILGYSREKAELWDLETLTAFVLEVLALTTPYVSPFPESLEAYRIEWDNNLRGPRITRVSAQVYAEAKGRAATRLSLLRRVWELTERFGEDKVLNALLRVELGEEPGVR